MFGQVLILPFVTFRIFNNHTEIINSSWFCRPGSKDRKGHDENDWDGDSLWSWAENDRVIDEGESAGGVCSAQAVLYSIGTTFLDNWCNLSPSFSFVCVNFSLVYVWTAFV